jgi:hypothetical protein
MDEGWGIGWGEDEMKLGSRILNPFVEESHQRDMNW